MSEDNEEWLDQNTDQKEKVEEVKPGRGNTRGRGERKEPAKAEEENKNDESDVWMTDEPEKKEEEKPKPANNRSTRVIDIKPKVEEQVS
jgi:hypothetical protein